MSPAETVAGEIQALIDHLEARLPTAGVIRPALEAQLQEQCRQLAHVKKIGGLR